jgi:hypothetical protein
MGVTIKVKGSPEKKKRKSETKEAVRRKRLSIACAKTLTSRCSSLAEELQKASGGGECRECRGYAQQCNGALKQQLEDFTDRQIEQNKFSLARMDYET